MKIWALLSWFNEQPSWLYQVVASVSPFVDGVVAVDGPYPLTPHESITSPVEQYEALYAAASDHDVSLMIHANGPMEEVRKRAYMFERALDVATPMEDWFLIIDGDMWLHQKSWPERARYYLEETDLHAAEVTFHNLDPEPDSNPKERAFRSLFRAIPGLTVEGTHAIYTVPDFEGKRLFVWQSVGEHMAVPALDLTTHIHLYHRPHLREPERQAVRAEYYDRRSTANIENVPDY